MKKSIKTDISLLNIYSLTNPSSSFFNGKSTLQNYFSLPLLFCHQKNEPPAWAGRQICMCGAGAPQEWAPPSRRAREVSSPQAPPLMFCTTCSRVWGQQQPDLSFPEPQRVVLQHRGRKLWGVEGVCFRAVPPICMDPAM